MDGPQIGRELPVFVSHYANYLSRFLLCVVCTHLTGQGGAGAETSSLGNIVFASASGPPTPAFTLPTLVVGSWLLVCGGTASGPLVNEP